jgi:hypothetical protein
MRMKSASPAVFFVFRLTRSVSKARPASCSAMCGASELAPGL